VSIAYQMAGAGPFDLVYVPSMTHHVEMDWENPHVSLFLERLASLSRLLVFDKRGTGMSDRVGGSPTLETRMNDIRAVMDAADSEPVRIASRNYRRRLALLSGRMHQPSRQQSSSRHPIMAPLDRSATEKDFAGPCFTTRQFTEPKALGTPADFTTPVRHDLDRFRLGSN
jgi:hypothetical protein